MKKNIAYASILCCTLLGSLFFVSCTKETSVTKIINAIVVTFNTNGGSAIEPMTVDKNTTSIAALPTTRDGYVFGGWYMDEALTNPAPQIGTTFDFSTSPITTNITLYAKWKDAYIITYDINAGIGTIPTSQSYTNTALTLSDGAGLSKTDSFFAGWTTIKNDETSKVTSPYTPIVSTILYALWKRTFIFDATTKTITGLHPDYTKTELTIPSAIDGVAVTTLGSNAFKERYLISITIPNSVITIGDYVFSGNKLKTVNIPNSVTSIGNSAFELNQLTSVIIPNSVKTIKAWAFYNNQITSITIPNSVTSIEACAFLKNQLTSVDIPSSITSIGISTFSSNQLTSINILGAVTTIGVRAFEQNQLTSITIPNSVKTIGFMAFANNKFESISIPSSVTDIGSNAFADNKLTTVQVESITPPKSKEYIFNNNQNLLTIKVPSASVSAYKAADGWSTYASKISGY